MKKSNTRTAMYVWAVLALAVVYFALGLASCYEQGGNLLDAMGRLSDTLSRPGAIRWTPWSAKFVIISLLLYALAVMLYLSNQQSKRSGEEYGSAKWGDPFALNRKYRKRGGSIILTQHVALGMDGHKTKRNANVLVDGGAGSGKTQGFVIPGVLDANASYLITDPKGEVLRSTGQLLRDKGYDVTVFDLLHPERSDHYNPFAYLREEKDVLTLVDNFIRNTTPKGTSSNDPFWEKAEIALDSAVMLYLLKEAPVSEQNMEMVLYMITCAKASEEDDMPNPLDMLFSELEEREPEHVAVKQYKIYKQAQGKTTASILVTASVRLAAFNIPQYAELTRTDDMDFGSLGTRKRAIFCVIPIMDASMNWLVAMLYTQCFQELYRVADAKYGGRLPRFVRVIQDEWANVGQAQDYPKVVATCRGYNIGVNIIVQNIQQIKAMYRDEWESIVGNCDSFLFLGGGNEPTTLDFISKLLGKQTIKTQTSGVTKGRSGSSSQNYQQTGRELMTPDELRLMPTEDALLLIRGERPVRDAKFDVTRHKNFRYTTRGGGAPYVHKPVGDHALPDLPYTVTDINDIIFLEEPDNEEQSYYESHEEGADRGAGAGTVSDDSLGDGERRGE